MAGVLFFVHGTGVRERGYRETKDHIEKGLKKAKSDLKVEGYCWGDGVGSKVSATEIDAFLPPGAASKGESIPEIDAEIWRTLLSDPLFELRVMALRETGPIDNPVGKKGPADLMIERLKQLDPAALQQRGDLELRLISDAIENLTDGYGSDALIEAVTAVGVIEDSNLVSAIARALVADALAAAREATGSELGAGPDALYLRSAREPLVEEISKKLSEGAKGVIGDWIGDFVSGYAKSKLTRWAKDRRNGLMTAASPGIGDIIFYQRYGKAILDALDAEIRKLPGPVHVLGHSLGGIMLVDLMSRDTPPPNVEKLITVGSQSPFFFAAGALDRLNDGKPGARPKTPWLNIYDRNDFLSFCAERIFKGVPGIEDSEVSSGAPFPESHGAYFRNDETYNLIARFCK